MAPPLGKPQQKPRPKFWRVVGGTSSGGLVVRAGVKVTSKELDEKLPTGSIVQELDLQGERLHFRKILPPVAGPDSGWVTVKLKEKNQKLVVPHKLRVWIMTAGTRGDLQPYLALGIGLRDAGFDASIWSCEDYRAFVESYGVPFFDISDSCEEHVRKTCGSGKFDEGAARKAKEGRSEEDLEKEKEMLLAKQAEDLYWSRFQMSLYYKKPIKGVDVQEGVAEMYKSSYQAVMMLGHAAEVARLNKNTELAERYQAQSAAAQVALTKSMEEADPDDLKKLQAISAVMLGGMPFATLADADAGEAEPPPPGRPEAKQEQAAPEEVKDDWESMREAIRKADKTNGDLIQFGLEAFFVGFFVARKERAERLKQELEANKPDLILYNFFWAMLAFQLEWRFQIPGLPLHLQAYGMHLFDPRASWVTEEAWPMLKQLDPSLAGFETLARAKKEFTCEDKGSEMEYFVQCCLEDVLMKPLFAATPIQDMGLEVYHQRKTNGSVVGFLSSVASDRFLKWLGPYAQAKVRKQIYTGFWFLPEKEQMAGPSALFGGPELLKKVEDFLATGSTPAYIGFGSCVGQRGRHWMCALSVAALMEAGMRGIILGGWAGLSMELLEEIVGADDPAGLIAYAKKNILFIEKAPQTWLFPKCSVIVIHGGVGTLAAAWMSGTPLIVLPVWMDQFANAFLNQLMGAAVAVSSVDTSNPYELSRALQYAANDPGVRRGAQAVQLSMMRDNGIEKAVEVINSFMLEDVAPGSFWWRGYVSPDGEAKTGPSLE